MFIHGNWCWTSRWSFIWRFQLEEFKPTKGLFLVTVLSVISKFTLSPCGLKHLRFLLSVNTLTCPSVALGLWRVCVLGSSSLREQWDFWGLSDLIPCPSLKKQRNNKFPAVTTQLYQLSNGEAMGQFFIAMTIPLPVQGQGEKCLVFRGKKKKINLTKRLCLGIMQNQRHKLSWICSLCHRNKPRFLCLMFRVLIFCFFYYYTGIWIPQNLLTYLSPQHLCNRLLST